MAADSYVGDTFLGEAMGFYAPSEPLSAVKLWIGIHGPQLWPFSLMQQKIADGSMTAAADVLGSDFFSDAAELGLGGYTVAIQLAVVVIIAGLHRTSIKLDHQRDAQRHELDMERAKNDYATAEAKRSISAALSDVALALQVHEASQMQNHQELMGELKALRGLLSQEGKTL
ncbi:MAG: hypothetical protein AAGA36_00180 [Pseudomonadota bacterium]